MPPPIETLLTGYGRVEAPQVDAADRLYFSDAERGGIHCREPDGRVHTVVPERRRIGGMALHEDGGVVVSGCDLTHCQGDAHRPVWKHPEGVYLNDLCTDTLGRILVGARRFDPFARPIEVVPGELYRLAADGSVEMLCDDVGFPNGVGCSPDGRRVYLSDSIRGHVILHDVDEAGKLRNRRVFIATEGGAPDGLAVDESGCVWVALWGGGCAVRCTPEGRVDARVEVPARAVTSVCFGGADRRDLYVTTADHTENAELGGSIHRTRVDVPGLPTPRARV
jgi:gluconolactonase